MQLKDKRVLITGSTSGIGWGIAKKFAQEGAKIMLHGLLEAQEGKSLVDEISAISGNDTAYLKANIGNLDECKNLIAGVSNKFGGIDVLINNAGIQHVAPFEDFPAEKWDLILAVNLSSAFHLNQAAIKMMQAQKWGRIINIASVHGLVASKGKAAYVAAKHALLGLTKVIALENAGNGVTCNSICPGWVLTPMVEEQIKERAKAANKTYEESKRDLLLEKQPSGEFAKPEDLGALAVLMCSEYGNQITGACWQVDGGWVSQ